MQQDFGDFEFLISILDALADPVFVKDTQHNWVALNDAFCRFMGHPREDLLGSSDFDYFPHEEARVFWKKDGVVPSTGQENVNEESFTGAEDSPAPGGGRRASDSAWLRHRGNAGGVS